MISTDTATRRILQMARKAGMLRVRDLIRQGIHPENLRRLCQRGALVRVQRGLYALPGADVTAQHSLAEASKLVPAGVVCLLSALRFHEMGTQSPHEIWMALNPKASMPRPKMVPLRVVRFSGAALTEGIEQHKIEGVTVKVYSPAKTVADCFKYRSKVGLDVALEALRECLKDRRASIDELQRYAKIRGVAKIMRPYLEALA